MHVKIRDGYDGFKPFRVIPEFRAEYADFSVFVVYGIHAVAPSIAIIQEPCFQLVVMDTENVVLTVFKMAGTC
jgi:hypothetical protein